MIVVHLLALAFSACVILLADKEAFAWMRGTKMTLSRGRVRLYHALTWIGLGTLAASGLLMAYPMRAYLLAQPLFLIKMLFVAILILNGVLIGRLQEHALSMPFSQVPRKEKLALFTSAAISAFSWAGAALAALFLF